MSLKIPDSLISELAGSIAKLEEIAQLKKAPKPTRFEWQKSIEQNIGMFNADAIEAMEILDALIGGLKDRYDRGALTDIEHEAKQLREALDELDNKTLRISPEDEAYDAFRAQQECDDQ